MTTPAKPPYILAQVESVLDRTFESLSYYAPHGTDETAREDGDKLVELIAMTIQAVASDLTDIAHNNPGVAIADIVATLRHRGINLYPESVKLYDPQCEWGPEEDWDDNEMS